MRPRSLVAGSTTLDTTASLNTPWQAVGPLQVQTSAYGLVSGRITSVVIDPNDATGNTVYAGVSGGGVWKSTNAAGPAPSVSFTPLTDALPVFSANAAGSVVPSLSIGALTVQPGGGVLLAGTGDPNDGTDSYYGAGILRSTDQGLTWSLVQGGANGSFVGEGVAGFAWSTVSPQLVVVAVSSAAEAAIVQDSKFPGVRGLYYSLDGGATWTVATLQDGSNVVQSQYTNFQAYRGNAAMSVVWNPVRRRFYAAVRSHGYYESTDGITWTRLVNQPGAGLTTSNCPTRSGDYGLTSCPVFRGALAVQPVSGDLFALSVDATNRDGRLWQDACAMTGGTCASGSVQWGTRLDSTAMEDAGRIDAGDYNLSLAAVPAATALSVNDTLLFAGATDLFRCGLSGGCSLRNTTNTANGCAAPAGVAPAQHAIAWQVNLSNTSTPRMFFGNDGGLWRSLDGVRQQAAVCSADDSTHFDNLNGALGSLAEVAGFSSHPTDANVLLAALGANGSAASSTAAQASGTAPWAQLSSGESGTVAIDQTSGQTSLLQSGAGVSLHACTAGTSCTAADFSGPAVVGSGQVQGDDSLVDAPALLDPVLNTNVIAGTCRVFRGPASGGSAWSSSSAISRFLAGPASSACNGSDAFIRSLAAGGTAVLTNGSQNSGSPVLYAGLAGVADGGSAFAGQIFVNTSANTANSSTAWTNITFSPVTNDASGFNRGGFDVSSIAVDPSDATGRTVYATIMGFGYPHLYRSTDAGGTWTNISANLPDAPANSVVVDPNDPLIVYVALDTGVYATTDVTSCVSSATGTTGSCWGVLGTALPNAPVLTLLASKSLPGAAGNGVLRAGTFGRGIWQLPLLSAGQGLLPVATFSPASLAFGPQPVGSTSDVQTVTLTNTGNTVLQITAIAADAGFLETDTCGNASLTVNASCTLSVSFAPAAAGAVNRALLVYGNVRGGYATLPLSGTGQGVSNLHFLPGSVSFPTTSVGSTSATQTVTLTNSGTAPAVLSAPLASPDFAVTASSCGNTLGTGSNCTVTLDFTPSQVGPEIGTLSIGDAAGTYAVALNGNGAGAPSIVLSPASLYFGQVAVNGHLGSKTVTVTNQGNATASLGDLSATGDFSVYDNQCPLLLGPGQGCTVVIAFGATAPGRRTGIFTLVDAVGTYSIDLAGDGLATTVDFSPPLLVFGSTDVGSTSAVQTITVTNHADNTLAWSVLEEAGDFGVTSNTCVDKLEPRQSCTIVINFAPTADGPRYGNLTLNDQYNPHTVLLSGTGHGTGRLAVSPASLSFGSFAVHSTSPAQTLAVANSGNAPIAISPAVITGDFSIAANNCGSTVAAGASCALSLTFTPQAEGPRNGTLTVADALGPHLVALSGTGLGQTLVTLSPAALMFPQTAVHSVSLPFDVTVSNSGSSAASLASPSLTGDFTLAAGTCGSSLAAGGNCFIAVDFTPQAEGPRAGTLTVTDAAGAHTVALSGTGSGETFVVLSPAVLSFPQTVVHGTSASQSIAVANVGTTAATLGVASVTGDFAVTANTCGSTLPSGGTCSLSVTFSPSGAGTRFGVVSLPESLSNHTVSLIGNGTTGLLTVTPAALVFADTSTGSTSSPKILTLSNSGSAPLRILGVTVAGDYTATGTCTGATLAVGGSCALSVSFAPTAVGARAGTLTLTTDSAGSAVTTVPLTANGAGAFNVVLSPAAVDFGTQLTGTASAVRNITISNTGNLSGALGSIRITGDFSLSANTCGTTLPAQTGCTVSIVFTPTASGTRTGSLTVVDDAGTQTATLLGTGASPATDTLSPLAVSFPTQVVNTTGPTQSVTLTNRGDVALTLVSARILVGDFTAVNGCGPTLPAHGTCSITVGFAPKSVGNLTGTLQVTDVQRNQLVALDGSAIAGPGVSLLPSTLGFANTGVGVVGAGQSLTLTNHGGSPLTVSAMTVVGDFGMVAGTGTCTQGATLLPGSSCSVQVAFLPTGAGQRTGSITVTSNAPTQIAQLSGTGIDFQFVANGDTTVTIPSGGSAVFPLLLRPLVTTFDNVTYSCTGAPANARCTVTSQYGDLSAVQTVSLTILTGTTAKRIPLAWLLPLLGIAPWCTRRRVRRGLLAVLLGAVSLAAISGCGSNRAIPLSGDGSSSGGTGTTTITPTGTYNILASATAAGVTHTVPLTLIVK